MPSVASVEKFLEVIKTDESKVLGVTIGSRKVTPGLVVPKAEAQSPPEISFTGANGTYIIICLDLDPPFPSFSFLGPILHWMQPGFRQRDSSGVLTTTDPVIAKYAAPGPPPMSSPHRYVFLLYEQPADFDPKKFAPPEGQEFPMGKRMRYDFPAFEKGAKLGPAVAANYFRSN